jgi:transposase InsO family protein
MGQEDRRSLGSHVRLPAQAAKVLQALGYRVGRYQARTLMREAGVWVRYRGRYRVTTQSNHRKAVYPNRLQRDFARSAPNRVWAGDITCPSGARKVGCTWRWSSTCSRAKCSVGRWGGA